MSRFKKKEELSPQDNEDMHDGPAEEVGAERAANRQVAAKAKEANKMLNQLLEANHFTIKIYRATRNSVHRGKT